MSGHGGAREGAGSKPKYYNSDGTPAKTKRVVVPAELTDEDIQRALLEKQKKDNQ